MSRIVTPKQLRVNDPYQQRVLQFDTTDSRVYLSRVSNYLLKSIGNDAVIKGFEVSNIITTNTVVTLTISPGLLIQDNTLIEVSESFELSLDLVGLDSCNGYLVLYTNYQYISSIEENQIRFKLSYITNDGLSYIPINDIWDKNKNRIYLNIYRFDSEYNLTEYLTPNYFYFGGKKYYKRGQLNFVSTDTENNYIPPTYLQLRNSLNSYNIFSQLYDETNTQKKIHNLYLSDPNVINISENIEIDDHYQLTVANPVDVIDFTILKTSLDNKNQYTLEHNLDQKYLQVQVYNNLYELIEPKTIKFLNNNSILFDFSNLREDLAANYKILIIKDISQFDLLENQFTTDLITLNHNLNKFNLIVQIVSTTTDILYKNNNPIILSSHNSLIINTTICDLQQDNYKVLLYKNTRNLFNLYNNTYQIPYNVYRKNINTSLLINNTITLKHNLNTPYPIVQLFDTDKNIILPYKIEYIDLNNINILFEPLIELDDSYIAIVYSYNQNIITFSGEDLDDDFILHLDLTSESILNPIFQLYDALNQLILPDEIEKLSEGVFDLTLAQDLVSQDLTLTMTDGFERYAIENIFNTFEIADTQVHKVIQHDLNSLYPLVQVYADSKVILPLNIKIIDENSIDLFFDFDILEPTSIIETIVLTGLNQNPTTLIYNNAYIIEFEESNLINDQIIIDHNLNFPYPIVQIYNDENKLIMPNEIQILSNNQILIDFKSTTIGVFFKVVVMRSI